jgi:hypothetical protein
MAAPRLDAAALDPEALHRLHAEQTSALDFAYDNAYSAARVVVETTALAAAHRFEAEEVPAWFATTAVSLCPAPLFPFR